MENPVLKKLRKILNGTKNPIEVIEDVFNLTEKVEAIEATIDAVKKEKGEQGDKGDSIKGDPGDKPSRDELVEIITPLIPKPIKGDKGDTPKKEELIKIIVPLIPKPIKGDKGDKPIAGIDFPIPKDGEPGTDASVDPEEIAVTVAEYIATLEDLPMSVIAGLDEAIKTLQNRTQLLNQIASNRTQLISAATQAALNAKENSIPAGTATQYYRGDKTFQTRDRILFTHLVNAGNLNTDETDLVTNTVVAATFVTNGDLVFTRNTGSFSGSGTATRQIKAYFAGTLIFDTGALSISGNSDWRLEMSVIRVSNTVVRCSAALNTGGASTSVYTKYTEITGLNLTTTGYILKSTGTAAGVGAATNDIVAKMGFVEYKNNI